MRAISENHYVEGSIEESADVLLEEWMKIIGTVIQKNESRSTPRGKYLPS